MDEAAHRGFAPTDSGANGDNNESRAPLPERNGPGASWNGQPQASQPARSVNSQSMMASYPPPRHSSTPQARQTPQRGGDGEDRALHASELASTGTFLRRKGGRQSPDSGNSASQGPPPVWDTNNPHPQPMTILSGFLKKKDDGQVCSGAAGYCSHSGCNVVTVVVALDV